MKKEHIILLSAGILLAVIFFSRRKLVNVIKPGDKGKEVAALQNTFLNLTGNKIANIGAYDNNTLNYVQSLLKGSNALVDYDKGYIDRRFVEDLYLIQSNAKNGLN